eukprot:scaffold7896_cov177-Ochromonas_danica.AAC.7
MSAQDPQQEKTITSDLHHENEEEEESAEGIVGCSAYFVASDKISTEEDATEATENNSEPQKVRPVAYPAPETKGKNVPRMKEVQVLQEFRENRNFSVLSMGKIGTGKSSTIYCFAGRTLEGQAGWADGNKFRRTNFTFGEGLLTISDAQGIRGNLKHDWPLLRYTISKLQPDQPIDMVILCLSIVRFNQEDESILYLLKEFTTPAFRNLIRVVITHAPERAVTEKDKAMIGKELSFLGNSPEEVLAEKVTFVDLISPLSFDEENVETQRLIGQKWAAAQERLTQQLLATDPEASVYPKDVMAKSYLHQFYLVYKQEIFTVIAIITILCLLNVIFFNWVWSEEQKAQFNVCLNHMDSLTQNNTDLSERIANLTDKTQHPFMSTMKFVLNKTVSLTRFLKKKE